MCEMHAIYHHNLVAFDIFMSKNIEAIDSEMWMAYPINDSNESNHLDAQLLWRWSASQLFEAE